MADDELSVTEASKQFGVPRRTIHSAIDRGAIPYRKIGFQYVVKIADMQHWLRYGRHRPAPPRRKPSSTPQEPDQS